MQKGNLKITSDRGHIYFTHVTGGSTAINSDGLPLYVIDGLKVGSSFERASEMVQRGNIKSVRVLSPGESASYGSRGGHGVILVETIRE